MPTWPATLPQKPLVNGSSTEDESNTIASQADVGIGQSRRRYTGQGQFATYTFRMTDAQVVIFDDWFHGGVTGIAGGSLPFDWEDPLLNVTRSFAIMPGVRPRKSGIRAGRANLTLQLYRFPA